VAAGFRTRRIKTENSIGDKLKKARIRKKITVAQVEEATKIRARF
jgi:cytoskeletal protein RodZ